MDSLLCRWEPWYPDVVRLERRARSNAQTCRVELVHRSPANTG